jgi:hypothetical protein
MIFVLVHAKHDELTFALKALVTTATFFLLATWLLPAYIQYILPLMPIFVILTARLFVTQTTHSDDFIISQKSGWVFICILSVLFGMSYKTPLQVLLTNKPVEITPSMTVQWIRENIDEQSTIYGMHPYYFDLFNYDYRSVNLRQYLVGEIGEEDVAPEAVFDNRLPDVFILGDSDAVFIWSTNLDEDYLTSRGYSLAAEFVESNGVDTYIWVREDN